MLYACDLAWWKVNRGVPGYRGLKLSNSGDVCVDYLDIHKVEVQRKTHRLLREKPGKIGHGFNSGFQALNLAIQFGARRIVLVGYDMAVGADDALHWHGRHGKGLLNPRPRILEVWRRHLDEQAPLLRSWGVEVVNASTQSALTAYPKMDLVEALDRWSCLSPAA